MLGSSGTTPRAPDPDLEVKLNTLAAPIFLALLASLTSACGASVRSFAHHEHTIRIDEREGPQEARIFVDECPVEGVYYDRVAAQWGVTGYTYGPSYWSITDLAEDMASVGAASCQDGESLETSVGDVAETETSGGAGDLASLR